MTPDSDSLVRGPASLVSNGVVVLFAIVLALSALVVIHHVWSEHRRRTERLRFEAAALSLAPFLVTPGRDLEREIPGVRLRCGDRAVALLLRKARAHLKGELADRISAVLTDMGEVARVLHDAKSRRVWRRLSAVRTLAECGGPRARKALMHAAQDKSDDVRTAAREGLLQDGSEDAVQFAVDSFVKIPSAAAGARRSFYLRLAVVSDGHVRALIESDLPVEEKKLALEAMGDVGHRTALTLAKEHLMSRHAELRASAIRAIGKIGGHGDLRLAVHALDDEEWYVRAAAARALDHLLSLRSPDENTPLRQSARERLQKHVNDPSWWVRANCARALARTGEEGLEALRRAADASDEGARETARAVLAMIRAVSADSPSVANPEIPSDFDPDLTLGGRTIRPGGGRL